MEHYTLIQQQANSLKTALSVEQPDANTIAEIITQLSTTANSHICATCFTFAKTPTVDCKCAIPESEKDGAKLIWEKIIRENPTLKDFNVTMTQNVKQLIDEITQVDISNTTELKTKTKQLCAKLTYPYCITCCEIKSIATNGKCELCFWKTDTTPKCITCNKFYALPEQDNKCSGCFGLILAEWRPTFCFVPETEFENGIISKTKFKTDCGICYETKQLVHKYACSCNHFACADCSTNLHKCPTCRTSAYHEIDTEDVANYFKSVAMKSVAHVFGQFVMQKWMRATIQKHRATLDGHVYVYSFFASGETLAKAVKQLCDEGFTNAKSCDAIHMFSKFILLKGGIGNELNKLGIRDETDGCADYGMSIRKQCGYKSFLDERKKMFGDNLHVEL